MATDFLKRIERIYIEELEEIRRGAIREGCFRIENTTGYGIDIVFEDDISSTRKSKNLRHVFAHYMDNPLFSLAEKEVFVKEMSLAVAQLRRSLKKRKAMK